MFLTPLVLRQFHRMTAPYFQPNPTGSLPESREAGFLDFEEGNRHVVIAGFGPTGRNLAAVLSATSIPYSVVEMNLKTIRKLTDKGIQAVYGDISRREVLEGAGIQSARVLAITFPDIRTAEAAVREAKHLNPHLQTMVRSRYRVDVDRLYKMGVDHVVYEEFETSVSFIFHIMQALSYPILETDRLITMIRESENSLFHEPVAGEHPVFGRFSLLEGTKIEWIEVNPESEMVGKTLAESQIRARTGVNVIAVINAETRQQDAPDPDLILGARDILVAVGTIDQLHALEHMLYD